MSEEPTSPIFAQLLKVIQDRRARMPSGSYTTKLFEGGTATIGAKIREEADEVVDAAGEPGDAGRDHLVYEIADLLYHLFVMMGERQIELIDVENELARRFGISGLDEKASRDD